MLQHIVFFNIKPTVSMSRLRQAFADLELTYRPFVADGIMSYGEIQDQFVDGEEYTHALLMTFPDDVVRQAYLASNAHQEFVANVMLGLLNDKMNRNVITVGINL